MLIGWPNLIETRNDLDYGAVPQGPDLEFRWSLDLNKQERFLMVLDSKSNREVVRFFGAWNGPLGTDIKAFFRREPIVQNLAIKGVKRCFNGLVVIVQLVGLV